jgi:hypothetical protein
VRFGHSERGGAGINGDERPLHRPRDITWQGACAGSASRWPDRRGAACAAKEMTEKGTFTELTSGYSGRELNKMLSLFAKKKRRQISPLRPSHLRTTHIHSYIHMTSVARAPYLRIGSTMLRRVERAAPRECPLRALSTRQCVRCGHLRWRAWRPRVASSAPEVAPCGTGMPRRRRDRILEIGMPSSTARQRTRSPWVLRRFSCMSVVSAKPPRPKP